MLINNISQGNFFIIPVSILICSKFFEVLGIMRLIVVVASFVEADRSYAVNDRNSRSM